MELTSELTELLAARYPGQYHRFFPPLRVGDTNESADGGAELIVSGIKTTTSSAIWDYPDGRIPFVGALSILLDGKGHPRAILETWRVEIIPFKDIDEDFAKAYGEGDRTLAWFRVAIRTWYMDSARRAAVPFSDDTPIICEWFSVAEELGSTRSSS